MQLPYFFEESIPSEGNLFLGEESSRHITQVLRMRADDLIQLTNGRGDLAKASITIPNKKKTEVRVLERNFIPVQGKKVSVAISLIKNNNRFEWFLEKATEIGLSEIIPVICKRTERHNLKKERMHNILQSAMLQSRQVWLPHFGEPLQFGDLISKSFYDLKLIAHCSESNKTSINNIERVFHSGIILIGPEGDFTESEINDAVDNGFDPVSLGETRLRTETAAIVAAVLLVNKASAKNM